MQLNMGGKRGTTTSRAHRTGNGVASKCWFNKHQLRWNLLLFNNTIDDYHPCRLFGRWNGRFAGKKRFVFWREKHFGLRFYDPNILLFWLVGLLGFPNRSDLQWRADGNFWLGFTGSIALGWGESTAYMGPNIIDQASGVFFGAFAMFAATTASIMSGAVIERI